MVRFGEDINHTHNKRRWNFHHGESLGFFPEDFFSRIYNFYISIGFLQ